MSLQYTIQQLPRIEDKNNNNYNEHNEHHNHNTIVSSPVSLRKGEEILNRYNRMKENHFPTKLYRMLEDVERFGDKSVISWSNDGLFFVVHQPKVFAASWMQKYFNQSKYKSFQRQLNFYKFQRVAHGKILGVYSHPLFRRGHMETLNQIRRIKQQPSVASLALKARNKGVEVKNNINTAPSTTTITTRTATSTSTSNIRNGYFMNHASLQTKTTKPDVPISISVSTTMKNQAQQRTISCDYFSNNIIMPPKLLMLDPALFVDDDNMYHEISPTMKSSNNNINNNVNNVTWNWNWNSLGSFGSSSLCPILDSNLLYEDYDGDATSIGTIEDVSVDICKTTFDQILS